MKEKTVKEILEFYIDDLEKWAKAVKLNEERPRPDLGEVMLEVLGSLSDFVREFRVCQEGR